VLEEGEENIQRSLRTCLCISKYSKYKVFFTDTIYYSCQQIIIRVFSLTQLYIYYGLAMIIFSITYQHLTRYFAAFRCA
jgi:hypothetical protein